MTAEDEAAFGDRLAPVIARLGRWETHDERARTSTPHASLPEAMRRGGTQAFLRLSHQDGETVGPLIEYQRSSVMTSESMRPGRLALTWFPDDHTDEVRQDFAALADAAWETLQSVTSPHVQTDAGTPARRYRIGAAARTWVLAHPDRRLRDHGMLLRVSTPR